jgi:hypothetical protein
MMQYSLTKPSAENYTPAGLLLEIARAGRLPYLSTWRGYGIQIAGRLYYYDHWNIRSNGDGTETVTVFFEED